jgi:hypothetical protein
MVSKMGEEERKRVSAEVVAFTEISCDIAVSVS